MAGADGCSTFSLGLKAMTDWLKHLVNHCKGSQSFFFLFSGEDIPFSSGRRAPSDDVT